RETGAVSSSSSSVAIRGGGSEPLRAIGSLPIQKPRVASRFLKILLYGYPGIGKTVLAATANDDPRMSPALLVDFEGGTLSIADKDVDVVRVTAFKQFNEVYDFLRSGQHPYKT